jgi:pimeloyl-ACP methyl ester carboxylesterase
MWVASQDRPEVMKALEASTRRSLGAFKMSAPPFVPLDPPAITRLATIKAPTLVVVGDRDMPSLRRIAADTLAKEIPNATLVTIPGADHALPIGWAKAFNDALLAFLGQQK